MASSDWLAGLEIAGGGMAAPGLNVLAIIVFTSVLTSCLAVICFSRYRDAKNSVARALLAEAERSAVFIFDDEDLIDATSSAQEFLRAAAPGLSDWRRLMSLLKPRFPSLFSQLSDLGTTGITEVRPRDESDTGLVRAEWWDGLVRVELTDKNLGDVDIRVDRHCLRAAEDELNRLRHLSENSPVLAWQYDRHGNLIWSNNRYLEVAGGDNALDAEERWPPENIFPALAETAPDTGRQRMEIPAAGPGQRGRWFDVHKMAFGSGTLCQAVECGNEVNARAVHAEFVQTLSKTFAYLPVGLAVFDHKRQLMLFNPALTDLTGLDVVFLTGKPQLSSFLDRLRDRRMIPEPKNYAHWREHLRALETRAVNGSYEENWPLPSGQTYRVSGHPHPNGAIAFQFEDITPEISLTRRFRAELDLGQAVLDSLQDALAVFSPGGTLTMSNSAYDTLWGTEPGATLLDISCAEAAARWSADTVPGSLWTRVKESVCQIHNRDPWNGWTESLDGRRLRVFVTPLNGGATLVRFVVTKPGSGRGDKRRDTAPVNRRNKEAQLT